MNRQLAAIYHDGLATIRSSGQDQAVIRLVKAAHTFILLLLLGCVLQITLDCLRNRHSRRTAVATTAVVVEGAIFAANGRRCPLTEIVEDLGDEYGQVTEIFLPDVLPENIFTISMSLLAVGGIGFAIHRLRKSA